MAQIFGFQKVLGNFKSANILNNAQHEIKDVQVTKTVCKARLHPNRTVLHINQ